MNDASALRILLLDDDPFMLKLLHRILLEEGWPNVTVCDCGHAALRELEHPAGAPGLILCDLNMPGMDGIEFIRELVARAYTGALILVSGVDMRILQTAEKLVRAHHIKLLGYLSKPVVAAELAALMLDAGPDDTTLAVPRAPKQYGAEELERAIINGELVNYYQPKVDVRSARPVGFETLVRWQHPVDGLVYPDDFIGVAEQSGLIHGLTNLVLQQSLEQLRAWRTAGLDLRVCVNVSMDNLTALDFPDMVERHLRASGQLPEHLVLEITESRLMRDSRATLDILTRLRLKGVRLSIDDFGTGHATLAQLHFLPFNELKIDKVFVHHAWRDPTTRAIYDASLGVAHQMRIESVAEGVEDLDDWKFLRETGCEVAQGFFIARPMPAADIGAWMTHWSARALLLHP